MTEPQDKVAGDLAATCRRTAEASQNAIAWFNDNTTRIPQEHASLLREFRKFGKAATKLTAAVDRPMCVGVFGPSQAGKSYLISALARRGTNPLIADFDGIPGGLDFVRQINPEGGAESTGLVTRFSMRHVATPAGFPVAVRLLSQADVVKILGNTYFSDCDLSEEDVPDAARIQAAAEEARRSAGSAPSPGLVEDDIWDIQEYFERQFKGEPIVRALANSGYWEYLAELAPRLPLAARGKLFGLLWGEIEQFTALYGRLTEALDSLGHANDAFCPIEALVARAGAGFERRGDSVIDVQTLKGLGKTSAGETLEVKGAGGRTAALGRAVLTGLIAELHVALRERPWDFFEHTDLLDFPGARSREHMPDIRNHLKKEAALESLFLRGKVAYLFERYNAEQELTSMLLCIAPSNQEVRTLPAMVKDWIDITHGPDPEAREKTDTALFLVLTKFDAEFEEAAGKSDDSTARWTRRLQTSLLDFFGKAHEWPHEWTPGHPFNNSYWLRNPNFKAKHIIDYDDNGVELALRASEEKRIARGREEYLQNPDVRKHFHDPGKAWDEAFRLNDGGITYLAGAIAPVCNPYIKTQQIAARIGALRRTMRERLQRYFVSDDVAGERLRREKAAVDVIDQLIRCAANQRFGRLIRLLQVSDAELSDVFFNLETRFDPNRVRIYGRGVDEESLRKSFGLGKAQTKGNGAVDAADRYALAAVEHWVESIRSVATNPRMCRYFMIHEDAMSQLVDELIAGAARTELRARLANEIRPAMGTHARVKDSIVKPAMLAANVVGSFVMWLGYDQLQPTARPTRKDSAKVFQPRPPMDFPQLDERPSSFDTTFYEDWFTAFIAFVGENAGSVKGQTINVEENARLGEILKTLGTSARDMRP
ncbi:MAG: virulence factor SrfC-like protein [Methylobacteriaceae bacterium]|nr:virulence factor SrfC-like protein [Methylobacteriaceae bacterium]